LEGVPSHERDANGALGIALIGQVHCGKVGVGRTHQHGFVLEIFIGDPHVIRAAA
jgi:hypothetical protein